MKSPFPEREPAREKSDARGEKYARPAKRKQFLEVETTSAD